METNKELLQQIHKLTEDYNSSKAELLKENIELKEQLEKLKGEYAKAAFVCTIDKMTESDWLECDNGFAERVYDRINNSTKSKAIK